VTISYPRALPLLFIQSCDFELQRNDVMTGEASGRLDSTQVGEPLWHMTLDTQCRSDLEFGKWTAWADSLKGALRLFYGQDVFRRYPLTYRTGFAGLERAGGGAFDGTATSWSVNTARDELTLQGLPVALTLVERDYVGFSWDGWKRSIHRVLSDANSNGAGQGTWTIMPELPTFVPVDAVATLASPTCLMKIMPGTLRPAQAYRDRRFAFEAMQHYEV
jgi:hypothetical protein